MTDPTDAAVEALTDELMQVYLDDLGDTTDGIRAIARYVITRQPKQEDVERLANALQNAVGPNARLTWPDFASAILALYPAPPHHAAEIERLDRTALRASAAPKPEAFLPEDYAHVADLIRGKIDIDDEDAVSAILSNNVNLIIAALRSAGGV